MLRLFRASRALIAIVVVMAAAACGGGAAGTAGPGATAGPATTAAAGTTAAPAPTSGGSVGTAACDLLSDDDIKEITGFTVKATEPDPADTIYENFCRWTFEENAATLDLGVVGQDAAGHFDRTVEFEGGTPIEGLGDRAARTEITGSILALTGDTLIDLFIVGGGTPDDVEERLVERALASLAR